MNVQERLELNPGLLEVEAAKAVFLERLKHFAYAVDLPETNPFYMSRNTILACALAALARRAPAQRDTAGASV